MELADIGTVTLVISENHSEEEFISDELADDIISNLITYLNFRLKEKHLDKKIYFSAKEWTRGCITIVITISLVGGIIAGKVLIDFIKDYKEVREGIKQIFDDIKGMVIWVKRVIVRKKKGKQAAELLPLPTS